MILVADGVGRQVAKRPDAVGSAIVRGSLTDVVLYSYGRKSAAQVKISGPDDAVAAFADTPLGI